MDRLAILTLYEEGKNMPEDRAGFVQSVVAYCTLNINILAFTVRRRKFFGNVFFELMVDLPCVRTGRPFGRLEFDTMEQAVTYGCECVKAMFPEYSQEKTDA